MFLSKLRYYLGLFVYALGLRESGRQIAVWLTRVMIWFVHKPAQVVGIYGRRSLLDGDFYPIWSDVDLTLLIQVHNESDFIAVQKAYAQIKSYMPWVKDIEVIDESFLFCWIKGGGFRKWSAGDWMRLYGPQLKGEFYPTHPVQRAFDLAWELRTIFEQFLRLHKGAQLSRDPYRLIELRKITGEFLRLSKIDLSQDKWQGLEQRSRVMAEHFHSGFFAYKTHLTPHITDLKPLMAINLSCQSKIMENLKHELGDFYSNYDDSKFQTKTEKSLASFEIFYQKFYVLKTPTLELIKECEEEEAYWISADMLKLFKAIGFHEQDYLLAMMQKDEYLFLDDYLRSRLMQDYFQALLEGQSKTVIYFCEFAIKNYLNVRKKMGTLTPSAEPQVEELSTGLRLVRQLLDS